MGTVMEATAQCVAVEEAIANALVAAETAIGRNPWEHCVCDAARTARRDLENVQSARSLDHNDEVSSRSGVSTWHSLCGWYEVYDLIVQSS